MFLSVFNYSSNPLTQICEIVQLTRWAHRKFPQHFLPSSIWKAIWVFIQHFPISGIISRYRELEFPISGNQFPISGNDRFPDIGKWFSDIGNWFSDIGKCAWFPNIRKSIPDIGKSIRIPDIRKSTPDRNRSLRHPATPPYHTAPYQQRPPAIPAPSACGDRHYDFSKAISATCTTNNNHTTDDFAQNNMRNLWCWINVLNDINKNWALR